MTRAIAAAAILALSASSAFAACAGHDTVKKDDTSTVASLDMSTTASTSTQAEVPQKPAETE